MKKTLTIILLQLALLPFYLNVASAQPGTQTFFLPGFDKGIDGVDFNYRSPLPQNEDGYILRNSF
jgi:hypothetical protein